MKYRLPRKLKKRNKALYKRKFDVLQRELVFKQLEDLAKAVGSGPFSVVVQCMNVAAELAEFKRHTMYLRYQLLNKRRKYIRAGESETVVVVKKGGQPVHEHPMATSNQPIYYPGDHTYVMPMRLLPPEHGIILGPPIP